MKLLFVGYSKSKDKHAYNHRIRQIEQHCKKQGADTSILFLGDLIFRSPILIQPLNLPFVINYLRRFDVISGEGHAPAYFLALIKIFLRRKTIVIYDVHSDNITESYLMKKGTFDLPNIYSSLQMRLTEIFGVRYTNYFSVAWPNLKQRLLSRKPKLKPENIHLVMNGVDLDSFKPQKETKFEIVTKPFTVTYAGSFYQIEGTDTLTRAAEILSNEDIHFKFIGFRNDNLATKQDIQKKLGQKATLLDWMSKDQLIPELYNSDILVIPADSSTPSQAQNRQGLVPTKFAEYLALGKPVIVTTLDGTPDFVKQYDCGFICEPTAASLAQAIRKAKATPTNVLIQKGQNGRKLAEQEFDYNVICKKYLQFLNKILHKQ
jgi:glycosyltransferase involved in cell wall biosynthesis